MLIYADELQTRPGWYICRDENGSILVRATKNPARDAAALLHFEQGTSGNGPATVIVNSRSFKRKDFIVNGTVDGFIQTGVMPRVL